MQMEALCKLSDIVSLDSDCHPDHHRQGLGSKASPVESPNNSSSSSHSHLPQGKLSTETVDAISRLQITRLSIVDDPNGRSSHLPLHSPALLFPSPQLRRASGEVHFYKSPSHQRTRLKTKLEQLNCSSPLPRFPATEDPCIPPTSFRPTLMSSFCHPGFAVHLRRRHLP